LAARQVREKLLRLAGHLLEADPADLTLGEGAVAVRGSPDRRLSIAEVARQAFLAANLPPDLEPELQARATFDLPQAIYAYGVNACEVEVDRDSGELRVLRYVVVDDCGTVVNPMIVDGQVLGGLAQGFGGTLLEELRYDPSGQLLTGSLLDYLVPTACDLPAVHLEHLETPSPLTPGGFKGVGEAGTVAVPAAVANALLDALELSDLAELALPLTPERVLALAQRASAAG
jgi:carbon-monoxide dehydrogenase large subunit